jgi:hypothetical protein
LKPLLQIPDLLARRADTEIKHLITDATADDVAHFADWYRAQWPREKLDDQLARHPIVPIVASCDSNGYLRERAVRAVQSLPGGAELPFLLLRLNDWVEPVREAAATAVRSRLDDAHAEAWFRALPALDRLARARRDNHSWLRELVIPLLARPMHHEALKGALNSMSRPIRRAAIKIAQVASHSTPLLLSALTSGDLVVTLRAAETLLARLEGDALRSLLTTLSKGHVRLRYLALDIRIQRLPEDLGPYLNAALIDPSSSVRELARFALTKRGKLTTEFQRDYRARLKAQPPLKGSALVACLRGLAETGTSADISLFLSYAKSPSAAVREAAILGVGRTDGRNQREALLAAANDTNLRVHTAACRFVRAYFGRALVPVRRVPQ